MSGSGSSGFGGSTSGALDGFAPLCREGLGLAGWVLEGLNVEHPEGLGLRVLVSKV